MRGWARSSARPSPDDRSAGPSPRRDVARLVIIMAPAIRDSVPLHVALAVLSAVPAAGAPESRADGARRAGENRRAERGTADAVEECAGAAAATATDRHPGPAAGRLGTR